ncbi:MAG: methyltransferase domain-containing protein, partial [Chloroflexota bacterium]
LAWLSQPDAGDILLDPFCGAGTILIERALMARYRLLLGGDLDAEALGAAVENIGPRHKPRQLLRWDAQHLPLEARSVNVVVTNLPFGVQIGDPALVRALYPAAVAEMERVLAPAGRLVLLTGEEEQLQSALARHASLTVDKRHRLDLLGQPASIVVAHKAR